MASNAIELQSPAILTEVSAAFAAGTARVEVVVEPDLDAQPWWLGERVPQPDWNVVKLDGIWFRPALELPRGRGRPGERGRRIIPPEVIEDFQRWQGYGETWSLYRMRVTVTEPNRAPRTEEYRGLGEHVVPLRSRALLDTVVARLTGRVC